MVFLVVWVLVLALFFTIRMLLHLAFPSFHSFLFGVGRKQLVIEKMVVIAIYAYLAKIFFLWVAPFVDEKIIDLDKSPSDLNFWGNILAVIVVVVLIHAFRNFRKTEARIKTGEEWLQYIEKCGGMSYAIRIAKKRVEKCRQGILEAEITLNKPEFKETREQLINSWKKMSEPCENYLLVINKRKATHVNISEDVVYYAYIIKGSIKRSEYLIIRQWDSKKPEEAKNYKVWRGRFIDAYTEIEEA